MKIFSLEAILFVMVLVCLKENSLLKAQVNFDKDFQDLKILCKSEDKFSFCSVGIMRLTLLFLHKEQKVIKMNIEKDAMDRKKAEKIRQKNQKNAEKWMWTLRKHFLDRHI
jgi:hypothetical protein